MNATMAQLLRNKNTHTASFKCLYFNVNICVMSSQHERHHNDVSMNAACRQCLHQVRHIRHGALHTVAQCTAAHLSACWFLSSPCCVQCNFVYTIWQRLTGSLNNSLAEWTTRSRRPRSVAGSRVINNHESLPQWQHMYWYAVTAARR